MKISILFILVMTFSSCQPNPAELKSQNTKPVPTTPAISETPAPTPFLPKNGNYSGKGVVTKINLKDVSVELDHEEIKDFMAKMIMEFFVKEKSELEKLKVGDKVDFTIEYKDGQEKIVSIKKAE